MTLRNKIDRIEKNIEENRGLTWQEWRELVLEDANRHFKDWTKEEVRTYCLTGEKPKGKLIVETYDELSDKVWNFFKNFFQAGWSGDDMQKYLTTGEMPKNKTLNAN